MVYKLKISIFAITLLFVASCATLSGGHPESYPFQSHFVIFCDIYDQSWNLVKKYPGDRCLFFDDGRIVIADHEKISMLDKNMNIVWRKDISTHHQVNFNIDRQEILVLGSSIHTFSGKKTRFDKLFVLNLQGETLKTFDFFDHLKKINSLLPAHSRKSFPISQTVLKQVPAGVHVEYTHANSFYQLPKAVTATGGSRVYDGSYVVNFGPILVLDKDLKNIVWSYPSKRPHEIPVVDKHDVWMNDDGDFVVYYNYSPRMDKTPFSSIDKLNPLTLGITKIYQGDSQSHFFSPAQGGTQILRDGSLLYSDNTAGGKVYRVDGRGENHLLFVYNEIVKSTGVPSPIQHVRNIELTNFLKNNSGL